MQRKDDFATRRAHLAQLSDEELEARFWQLTEQVVSPLIALAEKHTSPSIERSVLLRMGFSSLEAKVLVEKCVELELLGKGAGHVVLVVSQRLGMSIRQAGKQLIAGQHWEQIQQWMNGNGGGAR